MQWSARTRSPAPSPRGTSRSPRTRSKCTSRGSARSSSLRASASAPSVAWAISSRRGGMQSLRLRLLAWLLAPLIVVAIVAAGGAYMFLERRLTAAYDHDLGDIARALLPYVRDQDGRLELDFTPQAEAVLRADSIDQIYYALLDSRGNVVAGDGALPVADAAPAL